MRCTVLGAGSWGTALGALLSGKGYTVTAWDKDTSLLDDITKNHRNERYLPGAQLPASLHAAADVAKALEGSELVVVAVPSHAVRQVAIEAKRHVHAGTPIVCVAKGIELETLMTMSEVLEDILPVPLHPYLAVLSGPSFAKEVAKGLPTLLSEQEQFQQQAVDKSRLWTGILERTFHSLLQPISKAARSPFGDYLAARLGKC
jgi:glycerol-3-phosphate dehydrogenase (NAD(P)+)